MKYLYSIIFFVFVHAHTQAQSSQPKLVVGIVVDQMKQEYLIRFDSKYGEGGFKRMINDGFQAKNTHYNYIPTYTAPGHASIYTGTTPTFHGIISNAWYDREKKGDIYCVEDDEVSPLGTAERAGKMSPKNMIVNTITDELKLTSNFRSKVIGVSIKDRGAILPAGHTPDGAFWYDSKSGTFISSTWYFDKMPKWVTAFNEKGLANEYSNKTWETLLPINNYVESTIDNSPYESGFKGKDTPTFPYDLTQLRKENGEFGLIRSTPFGNQLVLDFAKEAVKKESLGKGDMTDFLAVSLSSTDYIGHNFGPNSIELEDTYIRLDLQLENFLKYLDTTIGKGEYLVFLTADHGVVANPMFLVDHQLPGGYIRRESAANLKIEAKKALGADVIANFSNDQFFLDKAKIDSLGLNFETVQRKILNIGIKQKAIAEGLTASDLSRFDYVTPLRSSLQNGYNRERSGDILLLRKPGYLYNFYGNTGTSHGTGYTYDTHVPLLFFGKGVKRGETVTKYNITDIAPTLAFLMNITVPNAAVGGEPISELFD